MRNISNFISDLIFNCYKNSRNYPPPQAGYGSHYGYYPEVPSYRDRHHSHMTPPDYYPPPEYSSSRSREYERRPPT
jgi:hypothetical protein